MLWEGDILAVYAVSALFLLVLRRLRARTLIVVGALVFLLSVPVALLMQSIADTAGASLADVWEPDGNRPARAMRPTNSSKDSCSSATSCGHWG